MALWFTDALLDYLVFYEGSFLDLLILDPPKLEIYVRSVGVALFVFFGLLVGRYAARRQESHARIERLNQVLRAIRQVDKLITQRLGSIEVVQGVCDCLHAVRGCGGVWISLWDEAGGLAGFVHSGLGDIADAMAEYLGRRECVGGCMRAMQQAGVVVITDPLRECRGCPLVALSHGRVTMCVRLESGGRTYGLLCVLVPQAFAADPEEHALLEELAQEVGFALHSEEAESALAGSEARLLTTLRSIGDAVIATDAEARVTFINPVAQALTGWGDDAVGRPLEEVFLPINAKTRTPAANPVFRALKEGIIIGLANDTALISRDGTERQIADSAAPIKVADGTFLGAVLVFRDVTEEYRRAEMLRQSERRYRSLFDAIGEGFALHEIICDDDGVPCDYRFLAVNPAFERLTGLDGREIIGKTVLEVLPDIESFWIETYGKVVLTGEPAEFDQYSAELDRHYEVFAFKPAEGQFATLFFDVTERRRMGEELVRQRDFSDNLVETAQTVVVVLDPEGKVLRVNRFTQDLLGYTAAELIGKDWIDTVVPESSRAAIRGIFDKAINVEPTRGFENVILAKDGREVLVRWFDSLVRDPEGKTVALLAVGHDVTEVREKEHQLRHAAKMEGIGRLAGGIAHDFNNMLAIIQGYADLLGRRVSGDREASEDVEKIRIAARRAAFLTRQLLALGKRQVVQPKVFQLNDAYAEMAAMLQRTMGEDVELSASLEGDLRYVKADPRQIEEVILNLAINAREAMPRGGKLTIETRNVDLDDRYVQTHPNVAPGEYVVLSVADTGVGMDPETIGRIFEPFFTTKESIGGTGLGLSVCYGIVTQNDGHIDVDSTPGVGTKFRVYLPATNEPPSPPTPSGESPASVGLLGGDETLLVAEDEEDVRHLIVRVLRQCGYTVLEAGNAREALPLGEHYEGDIDLLITDVVMPGMGGKELADRLLEARPKMKVLYISGYADSAVIRRDILEAGLSFLAKPFSPQRLTKAVRETMGLSARAKQK